jgi:hypothetical protein
MVSPIAAYPPPGAYNEYLFDLQNRVVTIFAGAHTSREYIPKAKASLTSMCCAPSRRCMGWQNQARSNLTQLVAAFSTIRLSRIFLRRSGNGAFVVCGDHRRAQPVNRRRSRSTCDLGRMSWPASALRTDASGSLLRSRHQAPACYCEGAPIATGRTGEPASPCARSGKIMVHDSHTLSLASAPRFAFWIW